MSATLLLEIGNSAWKAARYHEYQKPEFLEKGYGIDTLFSALEAYEYDELVLASVGSDEQIDRLKIFAETSNKVLQLAQTSDGFGVQHCYQEVSTLGVDRWLTLLVANAEETAAIIIDAGTAITLDVIDSTGKHLGGWIAPGMKLMQEALVSKSTRLKITDDTPNEVLGTSTAHAIHLGCKASLNGFVAQALQLAHAELIAQGSVSDESSAIRVWVTGGDGQYLNVLTQQETKAIGLADAEERPNLVLEGLAIWYQLENKK